MRAACLLIAALACGSATGANTASSATPSETTGCVEVEIKGERTPSFECLTQKLRPAPRHRTPSAADLSAGNVVRRPGNQLGLFNHAATGHRMGNAFGNSVHPQRPDRPAPVSPLIPPL